MKVLVVDDDDMALEMTSDVLRTCGFEIETARNGREALDVLGRGESKLVISDWEMPEMNGLELCRAIRTGDFCAYIYIILLTCHNQTGDIVQGLSAGADDFISKPFNSAELRVRVRAGERILALETRDLTIFALAKLAESRDPETGAHLERVRNYSFVLAEQLSTREDFQDTVTHEYCRLIYLASPLHDIGKVAIPDSVLLKPGRLSDHEFEIMKTHSTLGAQTLDAALRKYPDASFLRIARDIAASHHEKFDGSGYPHGLVGEDIPLSGRIVAVADVYDALMSKRVYKDACSHDVASSIISKGSRRHFDPRLVEAFFTVEDRFIEICNEYNDQAAVPSLTM